MHDFSVVSGLLLQALCLFCRSKKQSFKSSCSFHSNREHMKLTLQIGINCEEMICEACEVLHPLKSTASMEGRAAACPRESADPVADHGSAHGLPYCLLPAGGAASHLIPLPG